MSVMSNREALSKYLILRIKTGHYQVSDRENKELLGDVLRAPDGFWRGVIWNQFDRKFTAQSSATFTYRWEAIGFLERRR